MNSHVPVRLSNGSVLYVETGGPGGEEDVALRDFAFPDISGVLEGLSEELHSAFRKAGPAKVAVEFGLTVTVESGGLTSLLVKGSGEANLKITLEWTNHP